MTYDFEQDLRIGVDFNGARADGTITASERFAQILPRIGDWVILFDPEGHECNAIVESIQRPVIRCRPDWQTWRDQVRFSSVAAPQYTGLAVAS